MTTSGELDATALAALARQIAEDAGRLLMERFSPAGPTQAVTDSARSKSSRTDLVTDADYASEHLIVERLAVARPDDGVLAEEGGGTAGSTGLTWIVDPLDGTINYLYGFPVFAVSIACTSPDGTLAGAVHHPALDETFWAARGEGAFRDDTRLEIPPGPDLGRALVGTGFSYQSEVRESQAELLTRVLPQVRDIRRAGSAALDLCWVAAGRLDAIFEACLQPWDEAAGSLVVTEAGGTVERLQGLLRQHPDIETLVAAAPGLSGPLRRLLEGAAT